MSTPSVYPPSEEFVRKAHVQGMKGYLDLYRRAEQDPEAFWGEVAEREIHWFEKWTKVLDWNPPFARWFAGAKLNVSYNCLDRHVAAGRNQYAPMTGVQRLREQIVNTANTRRRDTARPADLVLKLIDDARIRSDFGANRFQGNGLA